MALHLFVFGGNVLANETCNTKESTNNGTTDRVLIGATPNIETTFSYQGIIKIKIPVKPEELTTKSGASGVLNKYLNACIETHISNADKMKKFEEVYEGKQDISKKIRPYSSNINNKVVENHAKRQVDFKTNFLLGDKMQFSHKSDNCNDDLHYFDRFLSDSGFHTEFMETKKDAFKYGVGTTFTQPRTDIINSDGTYSADFDKDTEAPFAVNCVSPISNFVVYSSYVGERPLFCVNIADVTPIGIGVAANKKYTVTVYTPNFAIVYKEVGLPKPVVPNITPTITDRAKAYPFLPIVEHIFNKERIGIIEMNLSLFNAINLVVSNSADVIFDSANKLYVFKNVDADNDTINQMIAGGAVVIKTNNPEAPADLDTVDIQFSQQDINTYYEQRVSKAYDIAGVPLASGVTSSGGDTGKARLLGGGWENAYTIIKGDIIGCEKTDYMLLKQMIAICKTVPQNKVNELAASQIEIHYNINPNDDILSKTQSVTNLYGVGMPEELILKYTNLSLDPCADAKKWADNVAKKKAEEKANAEKTQLNQNNENDKDEKPNDENAE